MILLDCMACIADLSKSLLHKYKNRFAKQVVKKDREKTTDRRCLKLYTYLCNTEKLPASDENAEKRMNM